MISNAIIALLLTSIVCATIGSYIVVRRLVLISGSISHASIGGVGIAMLANLPPLLGASAFAVGSALGIRLISNKYEREDSVIAVFWTMGMAVGIICAFLTPGYGSDLSSYLFGNVLLITNNDIYFIGTLAILLTIGTILFNHEINMIAFDNEYAHTRGISVLLIEYILMAAIGLAVVSVLRIVGIVLAMALLTIPQMTAAIFARSLTGMMILGGVTCCTCSLLGLLVSYILDMPAGATIVATSCMIYFICRLLGETLHKR